jgi:hypothetical protein
MKFRVELTADDIKHAIAAWLSQRGMRITAGDVRFGFATPSPGTTTVSAHIESEDRRG